MKLLRTLLATAMILTLDFSAAENLPVKKVLTLKAAKAIAGAAEAEANKRGSTVVIAVVDDGWH